MHKWWYIRDTPYDVPDLIIGWWYGVVVWDGGMDRCYGRWRIGNFRWWTGMVVWTGGVDGDRRWWSGMVI